LPQPSRSFDPTPPARVPAPDPLTLAKAIARAADARQGESIQILDISKISSFADYFVIIGGDNERHVKALYAAIDEATRGIGAAPHHVEGETEGRWILLDYIDVVVHIFIRDLRSFYNIDRLWADAPEVSV
jgi:ribosome-associated protein